MRAGFLPDCALGGKRKQLSHCWQSVRYVALPMVMSLCFCPSVTGLDQLDVGFLSTATLAGSALVMLAVGS